MFTTHYTTGALKARKKLTPKLRQRIAAKIAEIAADPFAPHPQAKKLQIEEGYRLRVGDWRVIYTLDTEQEEMTVHAIRHRNEGY